MRLAITNARLRKPVSPCLWSCLTLVSHKCVSRRSPRWPARFKKHIYSRRLGADPEGRGLRPGPLARIRPCWPDLGGVSPGPRPTNDICHAPNTRMQRVDLSPNLVPRMVLHLHAWAGVASSTVHCGSFHRATWVDQET